MTIETFLVVLAVGSALIAFWIVGRFPEAVPRDFMRAGLHVALALLAGWFAPSLVASLSAGGLATAFLAIFFVVLPILVYTFLSTAWVLKLAHDAIARYR